MSCKDVSASVDSGQWETASWWRRLPVYFHLAMCRHCRAFRRYGRMMNNEAGRLGESFAAEPGPDFDTRLRTALETDPTLPG
ncbi:MAG: hypothetical protein LBQ09_10485 [Acidobacteriaceae bacterium]|nr:hypothetical protein [Acidobacteriaceae bacterium]